MRKSVDIEAGKAVKLAEKGYIIPANTTGTVVEQDFTRGDHDTYVQWNHSCGERPHTKTWVGSFDLQVT